MSPLLIKISKDFATIWTTIDPIGNACDCNLCEHCVILVQRKVLWVDPILLHKKGKKRFEKPRHYLRAFAGFGSFP
jgi:hypothetical protein